MARAFGLEVTRDEVRLAVLDGTAKRFNLAEYVAIPIEFEAGDDEDAFSPNSVIAALKTAFKGIKGARDSIGLAVDSQGAVLREHSLPFKEDERIRQVIKFEIESKLPQHSIDDVVVDYYVTDETDHGVKLLVTALPKDELGTVLDLCGAADCDPQLADLSAFSVFNAAAALGRVPQDGTGVFLHVEGDTTLLLIAEQGTLKLVRTLRGGFRTLERTLARELGTTRDELPELPADTPDEELLVLEDDEMQPTIERSRDEVQEGLALRHRAEFVRRIGRDLRRTILPLRLHRHPAVYLSGGFAEIAGLEQEVQAVFGVEPQPLDVLAHLDNKFGDHEQRDRISDECVAAVGVAARMLGADYVGGNLRQEDLKFSQTFELIRVPLMTCLALLILWLAFENLFLYRMIEYKLVPEHQQEVERAALIMIDADQEFAATQGARPSGSSWLDKIQGRQNDFGRWPRLSSMDEKRATKTENVEEMVPAMEKVLARNLKDLKKKLGADTDSAKGGGVPCTIDALKVVFEALGPLADQEPFIKVDSISCNLKPPGRNETATTIDVKLDLVFYTRSNDVHRVEVQKFVDALERAGATVDPDGVIKQDPVDERGPNGERVVVAMKSSLDISFTGDPLQAKSN